MGVELRLPNINSETPEGQLSQIRSYLYQFAEELNWALNTLSTAEESKEVIQTTSEATFARESKAQDTFDDIKSLIIKSADIVNAYYEEIDSLLSLSGKYATEADFGEGGVSGYIKETQQKIRGTSEYIEQNFYSKETIDGMLDALRETSGYIRTGFVGTTLTDPPNDTEIGIEIGNFNTDEPQRFARYTAAGIELFDGSKSNTPVVTISQKKIRISSAEFTSEVKMGGYKLELSDGLAFRWEG